MLHHSIVVAYYTNVAFLQVADNEHPSGGLGGDCGLGIRDARLLERALRKHRSIPEALRGRVMDRLGAIVDDALGVGPDDL
jgi:hypothetical protein